MTSQPLRNFVDGVTDQFHSLYPFSSNGHLESFQESVLGIWKAIPVWVQVPALSAIVYYSLRSIWELVPVNRDLHKNAVVFIAGADSGFGYMLAVKCAKNGLFVFAGCLTKWSREKLEIEAMRLPGNIVGVELDVTNEESVLNASEFVQSQLKEHQYLWALVNNAGYFSWYGPDAWLTVDYYIKALEVNTFGMIRCTHAFLPLLKKSKGRIISVASVLGRLSIAFGAPYSVAKYGVEAYMDAIRQELRPWGISCSILEPGAFDTGFLSKKGEVERLESTWNGLSDEMKIEYGEEFKEKYLEDYDGIVASSKKFHYVVDNYYHAITARWPRLRYRCGWDASLLYIPVSYMPTAIGDLCLRFFTKSYRVPASLRQKQHLDL